MGNHDYFATKNFQNPKSDKKEKSSGYPKFKNIWFGYIFSY